MDASDTYQLIILIILLALSAFFSSNETALMAVNKIRLRALADEGNKRAAKVLDIVENHTPKMLSAILIGNNLVNITASSLATSLAYSFGGYMVSIATAALTVAILIFGEITPKNYATLNAEKITLRYIPILSFFMMIMTPFIFIINMVSRVFMKLLRVDPDAANKAMTEEELRTIVDVSHEDGVIESDEKKMIYNVFDLGDAADKHRYVPVFQAHESRADETLVPGQLADGVRADAQHRVLQRRVAVVGPDSLPLLHRTGHGKPQLLCHRVVGLLAGVVGAFTHIIVHRGLKGRVQVVILA